MRPFLLTRSPRLAGSTIPFATLLVATLGAAACGGASVQPWEYAPRPMADTLPILEPAERDVPIIYEATHAFVIDQFALGSPGPAANVDAMDEVVNSTWFTNRNAVDPLMPEAVMRGPHTGDGPAPGSLTITSNKSEGVNFGFFVEDSEGDRYLIKLDPPEWPEMASGADVLATNLVWAAGYNTPENYVYYFDPGAITLEDGVEIDVVEDGVVVEYEKAADEPDEVELTAGKLTEVLLDRYPVGPDGTIRTSASKFVEGIPKGPFSWIGIRPDDPNDVIPHELRREVRGYYVIASWLNQTDTKQGNTQDFFILDPDSPEDDAARRFGYLRHYMLDNGSSLGSGGAHPHSRRVGNENELDLSAMGMRFVSLGLYERPWQDEVPQNPPNIGWYEVDPFDPGDWRPNMPNPAFDAVDARDGYWGAKIVMSFTDPQLERAMDAAEWSDPAVRTYVLDGLEGRRDKIGRYWFAEVSPLDEPRIEGRALVFDDLWIRHFGGPAQYEWRLDWDAADLDQSGTASEARIELPAPGGTYRGDLALPGQLRPDRDLDDILARLRVWKIHEGGRRAPRPATFWLRWIPGSNDYELVGARY
ncbi:MAG: hypothetical protein ACREMD_14275 [Gemmatimonadota bacterium]